LIRSFFLITSFGVFIYGPDGAQMANLVKHEEANDHVGHY